MRRSPGQQPPEGRITRKQFLGLGALAAAGLVGAGGVATKLLSNDSTSAPSEESETHTSSGPGQMAHIIFDADMSSDHDDVGALATLHALADLGECDILAMMVSSTNGATPLCMDAINIYYGRPGIPIGVRPDIGGGGSYPGTIATEFPHDLQSAADCPHAAELYRQTLAARPDHSVTIVTAGYLTNLKALLQSPADGHSPLNGSDLVRQKVKTWSCMGGVYPSGNEFNFTASADDSAYVVVNGWPAAAVFSGFAIGNPIVTGGELLQTPASNPIRRVWELKGGKGHASWDQTAVYAAVRSAEGVWDTNSTGHNTTDVAGANAWLTDVDPSGLQDQSYLLERSRTPVQSAINTLMMAPPKGSSAGAVPSEPTNLRATAVGADRIDLRWTDNAYNEDAFVIERLVERSYETAVKLGPNTTSYSVTGLKSVANTTLRIKALNAAGGSPYTYVRFYTGWTEHNLDNPGTGPLYHYYSDGNLRWANPGDFRPNHVTVNNDSRHGRTVTVSVDVSSIGQQGNMYVYFFYRDNDSWYRLNHDEKSVTFEKRLNGVTSQVGTSVTADNIGNNALITWQIDVVPGHLSFSSNGAKILDVGDALDLPDGQIGLGGAARNPLWENFAFV